MKTHLRFLLILSSLTLFSISASATVPSRQFLGIAPGDEGYYKSSVIKCKDGSKKFRKEQLNDEFCDCPDGTDEPGTSACPEGRFYCRNTGHFPLTIFSSRVNDGICDCCDGSDEYDGKVNCSNTCWEAGKAAREKIKKKIATYQEGIAIRAQEVEKSKQAIAKDEAELSKLKSEEEILKGLVKKLKDHKEKIDKAQEEERLKKEKEEAIQKEAEGKANEQEKPSEVSPLDKTEGSHDKQESADHDFADAPDENQDAALEAEVDHVDESRLSTDHAGGEHVGDHDHDDDKSKSDSGSGEASSSHIADQYLEEDDDSLEEDDDSLLEADIREDTTSAETSVKHASEQEHVSHNTEGLSKAELGRLVASRWTGENAAQTTDEVDSALKEEEHADSKNVPDKVQDDENEGYASENDDDKYDDNGFGEASDEEFEDNPSPIHNEDEDTHFSEFTESSSPSWLEKIQQTVQNIIQTFNIFRTPVDISDADHVRKEYDDSSSKLSKIQSRISSLTGKLKHDFGKEKEFYSLYDQCFEYKENKYVYKVCPFKKASQVEGHSTTQLGHWKSFDDSYRVMEFSNGDKCWNGPDRSIKVRLRCGLKNELADVDEPSRCEYAAILSTPAMCSEEKLKELQQKLDHMNTYQPPSHDEL